MNKPKRTWLSLLLSMALCFTLCFGSSGFAQAASYDQTKAAFTKCGDYLYNENDAPRFGSIGGEWIIYGLGHAGHAMSDSYLAAYRKSVEKALEEGYRGAKGIFHDKKFTEYSRVIVAMSAVGMDATDVDGYDLTAPLADFVNVKWQGMNGPIWALIALEKADIALFVRPYFHAGRRQLCGALRRQLIHLVQLAVYPANAEVLLREIQITEPFRNVRIRRRKHADPTVVPAGFRIAKIQTEIGVGVLIEQVAFFFAARGPLYLAKHVALKRVSPVRALAAAVISYGHYPSF